MKIIHCADMHLDSKMNGNLDREKAKERKYELLATFLRMVEYAVTEEVAAIIIAGDLFDTRNISVHTKNAVLEAISSNRQVDFYYIKGNHKGADEFLEELEEVPENLKLFGDTWTEYELRKGSGIRLYGLELGNDHSSLIYSSLMLDPRDFNIVTLHGQIGTYKSRDDAESISLNELKNKNIDYLALGHIHEYQMGDLPSRGKYCYCGCLEGRGFDECGEHGFVLLDIDENTHECDMQFVPIAKRNIYELECDITGLETTPSILEKIRDEIAGTTCSEKDLVKIVLSGSVSIDCEKDTDYFAKALSDYFYFVKVYDNTKIAVDYRDFMKDASLKGEFVRLLHSSDLSEEMKTEVIRLGLKALNGEDIEV